MHAAFLSCFIFTLLACYAATPCSAFTSSPPLGNSIAFSASTLDGIITYRCHNGTWLPVSMAATLVKVGNEQKPVGTYLRVIGDNAGTWSLINTDGDEAESGHSTSLVSGKIISSLPRNNDSATYIWDFLSQASFHQFDGEASRVSYIMQKNGVKDEGPMDVCPQDEECMSNVTYTAVYTFWKQDMVPPASIPPKLMVDSKREQSIEAFFAMGTAVYMVGSGGKWAYKGAEGRLFDVPGGEELGSFDMDRSSLCLRTDVAAASACARLLPNIKPVKVDPHSLPWFLMRITNTTGNLITFGTLSSIQMVSTFRGGPPSTSPTTQYEESKSSFTAIFWIYIYQN